jgi:hypothetical protein
VARLPVSNSKDLDPRHLPLVGSSRGSTRTQTRRGDAWDKKHMRITKAERRANLIKRLVGLGFSHTEIQQLRRIEMTLQRWGELECGNGNDWASWSIERDETTDKPFMVTHPNVGKSSRRPIADRERGALKRLKAIMANHPSLIAYHQGDPRGCALYIVPTAELRGSPIDQVYNRGVAVCD